MAGFHGPWKLDGFISKLDECSPAVPLPDDVYADARHWITTRSDRPKGRAVLVDGEENVWQAPVTYLPDLNDGLQQVVCAYRIIEAEHRIVCELFAILTRPVDAEPEEDA